MAEKKGLDRGGTIGQEGEMGKSIEDRRKEIDERRGVQDENLDRRDNQKQRGGIGREPSLEDKQKIQPTHVVD